jgi:hypothetical protein
MAGYVIPSCGLFEYHHRDDEDVSATTSSSYPHPDDLEGAHHASIGMFRYHVLLEQDNNDEGATTTTTSCDYYSSSSFFFYNPNLAIFISQICGLVAPILGIFGVVLQVFAKTYHYQFANLLWLFAFGAQVMTWSLVFDPSFCFQKGDDDDNKINKDFATCHVTLAGYSNMLAAFFFLVAFFWSLTCRRKTTRGRIEPIIDHVVIMEPPAPKSLVVVEVPMGNHDGDSDRPSDDIIICDDLPEVMSDNDISLPTIQLTEPPPQDQETTIDDEEDPSISSININNISEREGPDGGVVDMQGQVVKELVEHKRFQEQGMKLAQHVEQDPAYGVETADTPAASFSHVETATASPDV